MKKYLVLLLIFFICYNIYGENKSNSFKTVVIEQELELKDMILSDVLAILSRELDRSIIADESCRDIKLDLFFSQGERLEDILDSICVVNNLKIKRVDDIWILSKVNTPSAEASILAGRVLVKGYEKGIKGVKITVNNSMVSPVFSEYGGNFVINDLIPGIYVVKFEKEGFLTEGKLVNIEKNSNLITVSLERDGKNFISKNRDEIFQKGSVVDGEEIYSKKIQLKNLTPEEAETTLTSIYGTLLKVATLPRLSVVVFSGKKENVVGAENFLKELDRDKKQVRITSQILDVTDNLFEELGFDWLYSSNPSPEMKNDLNVGLLGNSTTEGAGAIFGSALNFVKQFNGGSDVLGVGINILQSTQDLVISAIPSIVVADREEGEFKITEEVIVGEEKRENDNTEKTTYTPLFKEAGIILKVKPIIEENGEITLKIKVEVSNFKLKKEENLSDDTGTYNSEGGSKVGRSIETTVKMKDGETIFIGGLKRAIVHDLHSQVPLLGDIPFLKIFFVNKGIKREVTDIYIRLKVNIEKDGKVLEEFEKTEIHQRAEDITERRIYPVF